MRRILEARRIEEQHSIRGGMQCSDGREVPVTTLPYGPSRIIHDQHGTLCCGRRRAQMVAKGADVGERWPVHADACRTTGRQTGNLVQRQTQAPDVIQRLAAVQQLLDEPSPHTFPFAARIDLQSIQRANERAEAAEGRVGLGVKLLGEPEVAVQRPLEQGLAEQFPPRDRVERREIRR